MDHHLFWLDADKKWDIACDRHQWMLRRAGSIDKRTGQQHFEARWFVGSEKRTLLRPITGTDPRWKVELTNEAQALFDALPDRYPSFRRLVYQPKGDGYEFVGWRPVIQGGGRAVEAGGERELAKTGT